MSRSQYIFGFSLLVLGFVLLALSGTYYAYGLLANAGLNSLQFDGDRPSLTTPNNSVTGLPVVEKIEKQVGPPTISKEFTSDQPVSVMQATTAATSNDGGVIATGFDSLKSAISVASGKPDVARASDSTSAIRIQKTSPTTVLAQRQETETIADSATPSSDNTNTSVDRHNPVAIASENAIDGQQEETDLRSFNVEAALEAEQFASKQTIPKSLEYQLLVHQKSMNIAPENFPILDEPNPAVHISIPLIGVDSKIQDLGIDLTADVLRWETPKWVVGHIPTTARPGDEGEGWYFGHLESPIRGEGNVFSKLPEIPTLLRAGKAVEIILTGPDGKYTYLAYKSNWVPKEQLQIADSGNRDITLVTCYPRLHYDKRLLVTAALVNVVRF